MEDVFMGLVLLSEMARVDESVLSVFDEHKFSIVKLFKYPQYRSPSLLAFVSLATKVARPIANSAYVLIPSLLEVEHLGNECLVELLIMALQCTFSSKVKIPFSHIEATIQWLDPMIEEAPLYEMF
eukprot:TRINITY_DN5496_c0_g1_i1.p2 TRINITY_DN5496_c0_g1~~TRINITY_DN5496_c0_g1_i1.p2  ORF type:complete len:126 (+),score=20.77 TRINITY_DN5496_c0_g1_i1:348-725(+)